MIARLHLVAASGAIALICGASAVQAQTTGPEGPAVMVCNVSGIFATCANGIIGGPGVPSSFVPLSDFASSGDLSRSSNLLSAGVAMSSALDFQSPADGETNRIGAGAATFNDQTGVGVTLTHREGAWDASVGFAASNYQHLSKVSVGFSW